MTEPAPTLTKTLRGERYVIDGTLGEGSQATTLSAFDRMQGRYVAIKRFEVRGAKSWKDVELAEREATVLGALSHPKLPKYIEHFEEDGALYLVMEKIEGTTLRDLVKRGERLTDDDIARLLADLGEICNYLHSLAPPVVHRDIKPGNVIRRPDGSFALVDFGAVRDRLRPEGGSTVVGTFGYMAPEQFQGRASPASDWYAIGATCLSAWTGSEPETLPHRGLKIDVRAALQRTRREDLVRTIDGLLEPDPELRRLPHPSSSQRVQLPYSQNPRDSEKHRRRQEKTREISDAKREADRKRDRRKWRKRNKTPHPIPWWIRAVFWTAWAVAWPVIGETRALIVPWILAPFVLSAIARNAFSRNQVPALDEQRQTADEERIRLDATERARVEAQEAVERDPDEYEDREEEDERPSKRNERGRR